MIFNETELRKVGRGTDNPPGFEHWTLDRHYRLMANITLTGGGWEPIGAFSTPFTGSFNGGGFNISGLTINLPNTTIADGVGMFVYNEGTIENFNLINVNITSGSTSSGNIVGGLVSHNFAIIRNITVQGNVTELLGGGISTIVPGVVGWNAGIVQNSAALSQSMTTPAGGGGNFGRVYGAMTGTSPRINNHARSDMVFIHGTTPQPDFPDPVASDPSRHGADVSPGTLPGQFNNQYFWETTLGWDFTNVWQMQGSPPLPALRQPQ